MSSVLSKVYKAVVQPHKVPGKARRRVEAYFRTLHATRLMWPEPGRAQLVDFTLNRPVGKEVLVLTETSLVSPGTERAFFNGQPNARPDYPFFPGYCGAGMVADVGRDVSRFRIGDSVAADLPHASAMIMDENRLVAVPAGVALEHAAFVQMGIIALQGIRKARIRLGDRVAILGLGPIGLLATQLAVQAGAHPVITVARTGRRHSLATQLGASQTIALDRHQGVVDAVEADVTIDTTGSPDALNTAVACTRRGGRIVLLGSNRGVTRSADFEQLVARGVSLLGAHVGSLPITDSSPGSWTWAREADTFLRLLADRRVDVSALLSDDILPGEAELFYRRLSEGDPSILIGAFRWNKLPSVERLRGRRVPVNVPAEGADAHSKVEASESVPVIQAIASIPTSTQLHSSTRLVRIGLIGCGEIAVQNARAVEESGWATIGMVADVNPAIAADMGKRYNVPSTTNSDELLRRTDLDAVLVSVPHYLHAPLTIRAAQHGKHVMVEKPMATSVADADQMISACREASVKLSVIYCQRYLPYVQRAKSLIDRGALGKILGLQLDFRVDKPRSYFSSGFSGRVHSDWRVSREKSGGGLLIFNLVHYLDIIRYLTGLEVARVSAELGALDTPIDTEDTIAVTLRYANGAIGSITGSSVVRGARYQPGLRLWGTDGQLDLREPEDHRFYSLRQVDGSRPGVWHPLGHLGTTGDRREYVARFAQSILNNTEPEVSDVDGRAIQTLVEAIYSSGLRGAAVEVGAAG